jgi:hypothetical protein
MLFDEAIFLLLPFLALALERKVLDPIALDLTVVVIARLAYWAAGSQPPRKVLVSN